MENLHCTTVGHASLAVNEFVALIQTYGVNCIVDVRSMPYSRFAPQFNRESLKTDLQLNDIEYLYLGHYLGGRRDSPEVLFPNGHVDFSKVRNLEDFQKGVRQAIEKVRAGSNVSLMCAEKNPFNCHRFMLVSRELAAKGVRVAHILSAKEHVSQEDLEDKLLKRYFRGQQQLCLFEPSKPRDVLLDEAFALRNQELAFKAPAGSKQSTSLQKK